MRIQQQIKIARIFFILSAFYGLTLRIYKHVDFIPFNYKNILEGHSHVAFLGWGFLAVISLIAQEYFPKKLNESQKLKWFFKIMVFSLFGLLISFPIQGYHFFSILFLSIFLLTSYFYLISTLKEIKNNRSIPSLFIKTGILFYFLSSLAIWMVGIIVAKFGKHELYHNTIYFYLHFLYNGFFICTLFGIFFRYISKKLNKDSLKLLTPFYTLTTVSCILGYSLSLLWSENHWGIQFVAILSAILQVISLFYLLKITQKTFSTQLRKQVRFILIFAFSAFTIKVLLQFFSIFPDLFEHVIRFKANYIIGYIHLFTLGFLSPMIFVLFSTILKIQLDKLGVIFYFLGFISSEVLLFAQGIAFSHFSISIPYYDTTLLGASAIILVGLLLIYFRSKKREE